MLAALDARISLARRHVRIGHSVIVRQRDVVSRIQSLGKDASSAEELLALFENSQLMFQDDLARLLRERDEL